ncbi:succinate dehydrogenase, hydrophobic membrane anchor protein [Alteromonas aestuariivivens]|uniref:Succinate dehydrogenase hydrophobic membrane anchor subunit n=1 Tax=Alteromonas aestuariivivens TaxID=1938339 RepID=A0A3D8M8B0_9ALTE|nr:succinate dehydrogenase, hydrophobic membrane anchor protein [Alteromonas aestuariivivens]RDV26067.1 succinate dehydrogenase, hydrophobic membrane anchor protein [Alteromonas aestuariivivens]
MVTNQASIKRNGVQDFVSLRASAAIIAAFTFFIAWFFIFTDEITFAVWRGLFSGLAMKVFTLTTLVAVMIHVRIGLWQVLTDYVKAPGVRAVIQFILNLIAFVYVAVGLFVLWGI